MSEFIMIAPEGWVVLSIDYENQGLINPINFVGTDMATNIEVATVAMLSRGELAEGQYIEEIRRINNEFWVKIV